MGGRLVGMRAWWKERRAGFTSGWCFFWQTEGRTGFTSRWLLRTGWLGTEWLGCTDGRTGRVTVHLATTSRKEGGATEEAGGRQRVGTTFDVPKTLPGTNSGNAEVSAKAGTDFSR